MLFLYKIVPLVLSKFGGEYPTADERRKQSFEGHTPTFPDTQKALTQVDNFSE